VAKLRKEPTRGPIGLSLNFGMRLKKTVPCENSHSYVLKPRTTAKAERGTNKRKKSEKKISEESKTTSITVWGPSIKHQNEKSGQMERIPLLPSAKKVALSSNTKKKKLSPERPPFDQPRKKRKKNSCSIGGHEEKTFCRTKKKISKTQRRGRKIFYRGKKAAAHTNMLKTGSLR